MADKTKILEQVRQSVGRITRKSYLDFDAESPLELDSINRIALIVDLENTFQLELDTTEVPTEAFHSLGAITTFIATLH